MKERAPKVSQGTPKVSQKGPKGSQKGAKSEPAGAKSDPKGGQREPKVNQMAPKMGGRGEGRLKATPVTNFPGPFWEPFSSKNDEKIDAKIEA